MRSSRNNDFPARSHPVGSRGGHAATVMALLPVFAVDENGDLGLQGYAKEWGMRGHVKDCGTDTLIDCRLWQKEQWDHERWQRGAPARHRERERSVEERKEWCRRRTNRRRMLAEDKDAPGCPTSAGEVATARDSDSDRSILEMLDQVPEHEDDGGVVPRDGH